MVSLILNIPGSYWAGQILGCLRETFDGYALEYLRAPRSENMQNTTSKYVVPTETFGDYFWSF